MKKLLTICITTFALVAMAACGGGESQNNANGQSIIHNVPQAVNPVLESLAGAWDLVEAGILIHANANGTWETSWGDIQYRGRIFTLNVGEDYLVEFHIHEQGGPGAMHDRYGNLRPGAFDPETGLPAWFPQPLEYRTWLIGTYYVTNDRLIIHGMWGNEYEYGQEMVRVW